jgi:hypothetical protein
MMFNLLKRLFERTSQSVQPVEQIERYSCPFYGFYAGLGMLIDQEGNQCALIADSYSPCPMEMRREVPDLNKCEYLKWYREERKKGIDIRAFPREFNPHNGKSWKGISFEDWEEYVMNRAARLKDKPSIPPKDVIIISPKDSN